VKFCTVCGEWFDPAVTVLHCARPKAVPLPTSPALPYGDFGTVWPIPERREYPEHDHDYSEDLPTAPGYYVYRLWGPGRCLYVGFVGENGPRLLSARLGEHRRTKPWWPQATLIDAADCGHQLEAMAEEIRQIELLRPVHNILVGRSRQRSTDVTEQAS
jgi:hypothetical protein